ncbi:MAG TPA: sialidase family protein [Thermoanaerobaculia bacterium]|jgi:hypothetical protein|nr:sialidase family protein [Thermoanaerobaculia bacterium]
MRHVQIALLLLTALLPAGAYGQAARPAWPTLERQLREERAPIAPDSALGKLIRSNQDFGMLRPEEAGDNLPVPPWLRVWWRKAHPAGRFPANDPTGGYPLVLKEIHEWMVSHPDLQGGDGTLHEKRGGHPKPTVTFTGGPELEISGPEVEPRSESDIRINFWNSDQIISASNNISGNGALAVFSSQDGGGSWRQTTLPKEASAFHSDPTVEWTSDGTAWATALSITGSTLVGDAFRSTDGGVTWKLDGPFSGDQQDVDKQMTWVDHFDGSPFKDTLYAIWHNGEQVFVNRRTADGWGQPLQVSGDETAGTGIGADIKTNQQGTVFAFWPDTGTQKIFMTRSTDGGNSFSRPLAIGKTFADFQFSIPAQFRRNALIYVTGGAFYRGPKRNQNLVYAAWADLAGGRGCSSPADQPGNNRASGCTSRIWFTRSTNGGISWSRPGMINNQRDTNDQFNPWLAVDPTSGTLGIIYYDTIGEERPLTNVWAQVSSDDGASWSAPYRVTAEASNENDGLPNGNQYGDYNGLSGYAGTFFPAWTDRRGGFGTKEAIWTAPLTLQLKARSAAAAEKMCPFAPLSAGEALETLLQPACTQ